MRTSSIFRVWVLAVVAVLVALPFVADAQNCPNNCSGRGQCTGTTCHCYPGWLGEDCSYQNIPLTNATSVSGRLQTRQWAYYSYELSDVGNLRWTMQHEAGGDCDLYVNPITFPTRSRWFMRDISTDQSTSLLVPNAQAATWYAGVYGFSACNFQLSVFAYPGCPKNCSGHGICLNGACQCDAGYGTADCSQPSAQQLISGQTIVEESISRGEWKFYETPGVTAGSLIRWTMNQTTRGDADIFVQVGHYPNFTNFIGRDTSMNSVSRVEVRALLRHGSASFFAGVFGFLACSYNIRVDVISNSTVCRDTTNCSLHGLCSPSGSGCLCSADYNGTNCEYKRTPLEINHPMIGYVADNSWNYYVVRSTVGQSDLALHVSHTNRSTQGHGTGDCDLYVRANAYPTRTQYDFADITADQDYTLTVPNPVTEQVAWYIGIFGWSACEYTLVALPDNGTRNCGPHGIDAGGGHCTCLDYYAGETCSVATTGLTSGVPVTQSLTFNKWAYFHISPPATSGEAQALEVHLQELSQLGVYGNLWLYISAIQWPNLRIYDQADTHINNLHTVYDNTFDSDAFIGVYVSPYADPAQTYNFTLVAWYPDFKK